MIRFITSDEHHGHERILELANHEVWACLPAASAVYLLGVTLFDALIKNY